jgi:hypothetical protein
MSDAHPQPTQPQQLSMAVEVTRGDDHLSIWVDANQNGIKDDDDVNIFVTEAGGFYTESPTFVGEVDGFLRDTLKELALEYMKAPGQHAVEQKLCDVALKFVEKATTPTGEVRELPPLPPGVEVK